MQKVDNNEMISQFGLKYVPVDLENLDVAYKIQKRTMARRSRL